MTVNKNKILNAGTRTKWHNKNYFFVTTGAFLAINILLFACIKDASPELLNIPSYFLSVFIHIIADPFLHPDGLGLLNECLCFVFVGAYLERKKGSFGFAIVIAAVLFFSSIGMSMGLNSFFWSGFTGLNYGLFGYAIADYLFSVAKIDKAEKIVGGIMMGLIYIFSCFSIPLGLLYPYPFPLFAIAGNLPAFSAGLVFGLSINLALLFHSRASLDEKTSDKLDVVMSDANGKKVTWLNRNYFFACTVFIVLLCFILFEAGGNEWPSKISNSSSGLSGLLRGFCNSIGHHNFQHVLGNMMCFFVLGIYLERKHGSLPFFLLVLAMIFFTSMMNTAMDGQWWIGYSSVNFAFYGYVIVDYCFTLGKKKKSIFDIISGAVMMGLIYLAMCHNGGTEKFGFAPYPYDLIFNSAHWSGIVIGIVLSVCIHSAILLDCKSDRFKKSIPND